MYSLDDRCLHHVRLNYATPTIDIDLDCCICRSIYQNKMFFGRLVALRARPRFANADADGDVQATFRRTNSQAKNQTPRSSTHMGQRRLSASSTEQRPEKRGHSRPGLTIPHSSPRYMPRYLAGLKIANHLLLQMWCLATGLCATSAIV